MVGAFFFDARDGLEIRAAVGFPAQQRPRDRHIVGSNCQELREDALARSSFGFRHNRRRVTVATKWI